MNSSSVSRSAGREIANRHLHADRGAALFEIAQPGSVLRLGPRIDRALVQRERGIGDHAVHVEIDRVAEALAARARAHRRVEAEQNRFRLVKLHAAGLALKSFVETQRRGASPTFAGRAFEDYFAGLAVADLDGVDQALVQFRPNRQPVHQHEDGLGEVDIQQRLRSGELEDAAALEQPVEALLSQFEKVIPQGVAGGVVAARKQRVPARALGLHEQPRRHFVHRVLAHARTAIGAERLTHAGVEQAQKVEALRGGGHRGARIARGVLLPDRDGGRDAVDIIHVGLFHALQELARIGGERFHVAPLPLRVDRVERQRRFAGPRHTRDHGQLFVGNRKRNVLEIVDPRTLDPDIVFHWNFHYTIRVKRRRKPAPYVYAVYCT